MRMLAVCRLRPVEPVSVERKMRQSLSSQNRSMSSFRFVCGTLPCRYSYRMPRASSSIAISRAIRSHSLNTTIFAVLPAKASSRMLIASATFTSCLFSLSWSMMKVLSASIRICPNMSSSRRRSSSLRLWVRDHLLTSLATALRNSSCRLVCSAVMGTSRNWSVRLGNCSCTLCFVRRMRVSFSRSPMSFKFLYPTALPVSGSVTMWS